MLAPIHNPEQHTKKQHAAKHQDAIIHVLYRRVHRCRPHGEESAKQGIYDCQNCNGHTGATKLERAPGQVAVWSCEAFVQHDGGGKDEGGIVRRNDERNERSEADRGSNIDEGEKEIDDCGSSNCV